MVNIELCHQGLCSVFKGKVQSELIFAAAHVWNLEQFLFFLGDRQGLMEQLGTGEDDCLRNPMKIYD